MKIPIGKYKPKEQTKESDEDEIDDEFTEEEIRSLYPASEILNKIYSDHVYTASRHDNQSKPGQDCWKETSKNLASTSDNNVTVTTVTCSDTQKNNVIYKLWHPVPVPMLNPNLKMTASTSSQRMTINTRHSYKSSDADISASLNAESIQQVFQNMINMTSLAPMVDTRVNPKYIDGGGQTSTTPSDADKSSLGNEETNVDKEDEHSFSSADKQSSGKIRDTDPSKDVKNTDDKPAIIKRKKYVKQRKSRAAVYYDQASLITGNREKTELNNTPGSSPRPSVSKSRESLKCRVESKQYSTDVSEKDKHTDIQQLPIDQQSSKYKAVEQEVNTLLHATTSLLVRRWGEYLHMTTTEINDFAIKEAKDAEVVGEVVEMLEDTDRYVWKLVDELSFY